MKYEHLEESFFDIIREEISLIFILVVVVA
ncbi:hypothetical protein LINPERPRIM_LOCUS2754 [Linum perenne]